MSILTQIASRDEFLVSVYKKSNSQRSREQAESAFKKWDVFLAYTLPGKKEHDILDELKRIQSNAEFYQFLNRFVQFMTNQELSRMSIKSYFNQIKSWLRFNSIRVHNDDVKQFVNFPRGTKEIPEPLTHEKVRKLITCCNNSKMLALIYTLASTGMRVNEALQLRWCDIKGNKLSIRAHTVKTRQAREGRISMQALDHIEILRKNDKPEDYIFVKTWTPHTSNGFETQFSSLRKKAGLLAKYDNGRYHVNIHSFRSFFFTNATMATNGDIAHALTGHGAYLAQYMRLPEDKKAELYSKIEEFVTIK